MFHFKKNTTENRAKWPKVTKLLKKSATLNALINSLFFDTVTKSTKLKSLQPFENQTSNKVTYLFLFNAYREIYSKCSGKGIIHHEYTLLFYIYINVRRKVCYFDTFLKINILQGLLKFQVCYLKNKALITNTIR